MKDFTRGLGKGLLTILLCGVSLAAMSQQKVTSASVVPGATTAAITWATTGGGGTVDRIVILADVAPGTATPNLNAINPTVASAPWNAATLNYSTAPFVSGSSGPKIVYNGTDTSPQTITNLTAATGYYYTIYSWQAAGPTWSDSGGGGAGTGFALGPIQLATTLTATGYTRNAGAGELAKNIFDLSLVSNGAQTLDQLVFTFSVDVATILDPTKFVLKNGGTTVGTAVYAAGAKTVTVSGIGLSLATTKTLTLLADVLGAAPISSQTVQLTSADVTVTGGGIVNSFTTVTNTVNIVAMDATVAAVAPGTAPVVANASTLGAGDHSAIAGFSVSSSGTQSMTNVNFHYTGLASQFTTISLYKNTTSSLSGSTLVKTSATGSFDLTASPESVTSTLTYYFLVVDVAGNVTPATAAVTVTQAQTDIVFAAGGTIGTFGTTNTVNFSQSANSTIALNGGTTTNIAYGSFQAASGLTTGNSETLATFEIRDGGGAADGDVLPTTITAFTISVANAGNVRMIGLFDGGTLLQEKPAAATVSFTGLTLSATDAAATKSFSIRATFQANVTDNNIIQVAVTAATDDPAGSRLKSSGALTAANTGGATNKIDVVANKFIFVPAGPIAATQNTEFALSVQMVDGLNNIDIDRSQVVTLDIQSGGGAISDPGPGESLSVNVVAGQYSWSHVKLSGIGAIVVRAQYSVGGITPGLITVNVASLGVTVIPANKSMCNGGEFVALTPITVQESDDADFGTGNNQFFYLQLPNGFIFDTSVTTAPTVTGADISSPSALSYVGNSIVRFKYNISATASSDKFVINGLKVKYPDTTLVSGNITVINSSASVKGDTEADNKSHGLLTSVRASDPPGFKFITDEQLGGTTIDDNQLRFNVSIQSVKLEGTPTGGTFVGNGVSLGAGGKYTFSPAAVGVGSNYLVTYLYTDPGSHCTSVITKSFEVFASNISNLNTINCQNDAPSTNLTVTNTYITNTYGAGYAFTRFLYVEANGIINAGFFSYPSYIYPYTTLSTANGSAAFDPNDSRFRATYGYEAQGYNGRGIYIGFEVSNGTYTYAEYQFVQVKAIPVVSFTTLVPTSSNLCANSAPITLVPSPPISVPALQNFSATGAAAAGLVNPSGTWMLDPAAGGGTSTGKPINIRYNYTDTQTGCSNSTPAAAFKIYSVPAAVPASDVTSGIALTICTDNNAPTFTAAGSGSPSYTWYDASNNALSFKSSFAPSVPSQLNNAASGTTTYKVSQTLNGCEGPTTNVSIIVKDKPTVSISTPAAVCAQSNVTGLVGSFNSGFPTLTGAWTTNGSGTFSAYNANVSGNNVTYTPDPGGESVDPYIFAFTTSDPDGPTGPCLAATQSVKVIINAIPLAPIIDGSPQISYCVKDNLRALKATKGSSLGVIKWYADNGSGGKGPFLNAADTLQLTISNTVQSKNIYHAVQESAEGCQGNSLSTITVVLNPVPNVKFSADQLCTPSATLLDASGTDLPLINPDPAGPSKITGYQWGYPATPTTLPSIDTGKVVSHIFPAGLHDVTLTVFTNKQSYATQRACQTTIKSSDLVGINPHIPNNTALRVGMYPNAAITVTKQCQTDTTTFKGLDANLTTGPSFAWDFGDTGTGTGQNIRHYFTQVKTYDVRLIVTSDLGCADTVHKATYLLPLLTSFPYVRSFEAGTDGWASEGLGTEPTADNPFNSWRRSNLSTLGTRLIKKAALGSYAWIAYDSTMGSYNNAERSVLNGPCIAMDMLTRPALSFDYWNDTEKGNDGVYIEYTINGTTWQRLGSDNEADLQHWYDDSGIIGLSPQPGSTEGQAIGQLGWSGSSGGWTNAKYALDALSHVKVLRLRFFFGSLGRGSLSSNKDGFAIDNIRIADRNRVLLAENFTNLTGSGATTSAAVVNTKFREFKENVALKADPEIVKIQYHTNIGGADSLYTNNPGDQQARATFYGVTSSFKGELDGYSNGLIDSTTWAGRYYAGRALIPAPLDIDVSVLPSPNAPDPDDVIRLSYTITAKEKLPPGNYLIHVALVEKDANGQSNLRKLLPDANGVLLTALDSGATQTNTLMWSSSTRYNTSQMQAIVFVQDLSLTSEVLTNISYHNVLQAGVTNLVPIDVVTGIEPTANNVSLYPNPSDREFTLELPYEAKQNIPVQLIDPLGKVAHSGEILKGKRQLTLTTAGLHEGVYIVLFKEKTKLLRRKVIIIH